jgi:hypothetical protein
MGEDRSFTDALERVRAAAAAMGSGNPQPYIDCWAESEDATLFGGWGPIEKGYQQLTETFRWVGSRFKSGPLVPENTVAFASGELAYTGRGRGSLRKKRPMRTRISWSPERMKRRPETRFTFYSLLFYR